MKSSLTLRPRQQGFTLIELLTVITIIVILSAITIGTFTYANKKASESKSLAGLKFIENGLQKYKDEHGEYPTPNGNLTYMSTLDATGAACLYQALSGDGSNSIQGVTPSTNSNGLVDANNADEKKYALIEVPRDMIGVIGNVTFGNNGNYFLRDGFGQPYQYHVPDRNDKTKSTRELVVGGNYGSGTWLMKNPTYDLWSISSDNLKTSAKNQEERAMGWLKNW